MVIMITCLVLLMGIGLYSWATSLAQKQAQDAARPSSIDEADYEIRRGGPHG